MFLACLLVTVYSMQDARALPVVAYVSKEVATETATGGGSDDVTTKNNQSNGSAQPTPLTRITFVATGHADIDVVPQTQKISVVEDWSSVCQHLCRAGLGGTPCGAYCEAPAEVQLLPTIVTDAFLGICPVLCANQLGFPQCKCPPVFSLRLYNPIINPSVKDDICSFGCVTQTPLNGCSKCVSNKNQTDPTQITYTTLESESTLLTEPDSSPVFTEDTMSSPTTMISTTTTTTTTTVQTTTTTKAPTTPNWQEHCQHLCRIGEGGSACNCDLPPFF